MVYTRVFHRFNPLTANYSIWIFTHLKLCLADAIQNFKWVKKSYIFNVTGDICKSDLTT